ncbi:hypothetical protein ABPG74_002222 [Tetrahymena malaccensis]
MTQKQNNQLTKLNYQSKTEYLLIQNFLKIYLQQPLYPPLLINKHINSQKYINTYIHINKQIMSARIIFNLLKLSLLATTSISNFNQQICNLFTNIHPNKLLSNHQPSILISLMKSIYLFINNLNQIKNYRQLNFSQMFILEQAKNSLMAAIRLSKVFLYTFLFKCSASLQSFSVLDHFSKYQNRISLTIFSECSLCYFEVSKKKYHLYPQAICVKIF